MHLAERFFVNTLQDFFATLFYGLKQLKIKNKVKVLTSFFIMLILWLCRIVDKWLGDTLRRNSIV
jgi:hypothetical protein